MEQGIYPNVSSAEYHSLDAVSNSYLSRLNKCPANAKIPQDETAAMITGRAFHCFILEGMDAYMNQFAVAPPVDKRTKEGKAAWNDFMAQNSDKTVITKDDHDGMVEMADAVIKHPFAIKCLAEGRSEMSVFWQDKETGLDCKCRPDRIPDGEHGVIVDIKTTTDASQKAFRSTIMRYGYHRQAAFYIDGFNSVCSANVDAFIFIAVEKDPPYMVGCYTLENMFIDYGRSEYRRLMELEKECRKEGYPHYIDEGLVELQLPNYF